METSITMLDGLQRVNAGAWRRMVEKYSPLIRGWLRRYALAEHDADDLVQEVMAIVVRKLPAFRRQPRAGSFRSWLRHITFNCLRGFWRTRRGQPRLADGSPHRLEQVADPDNSMSRFVDRDHDDQRLHRLLISIEARFEPRTWQVFQRVALEQASVDQVARELGMSVNAVFIAKSRVLNVLRRESQDLFE